MRQLADDASALLGPTGNAEVRTALVGTPPRLAPSLSPKQRAAEMEKLTQEAVALSTPPREPKREPEPEPEPVPVPVPVPEPEPEPEPVPAPEPVIDITTPDKERYQQPQSKPASPSLMGGKASIRGANALSRPRRAASPRPTVRTCCRMRLTHTAC